jgi:tripartite-type tricarboxylate transporter receptor subunit TctC
MDISRGFRHVGAILPAVFAALLAVVLADGAKASCAGLEGDTIRWIVPSHAGGGYDAYSRLLQPFLEERLRARLIIENRPEAGGIVGASQLRDAAPDGATLGLINASGLLAVHALEDSRAPDPLTDFSLIGRVVSNHAVLFTGRDSGFSDIHALLEASRNRPVVVAVRDAGSVSMFSIPVTASLLGMPYELVGGYSGSASRTLALIRGEADIALSHLDSVESQMESGELVPLLRISGPATILPGIPALGGPDGLAVRRAAYGGRSPSEAREAADELAALIGAGRVVVAPAGLPASLHACLEQELSVVLAASKLKAAAQRAGLSLEPAGRAETRVDLLAGARSAERFRGLIRAAVAETRE